MLTCEAFQNTEKWRFLRFEVSFFVLEILTFFDYAN